MGRVILPQVHDDSVDSSNVSVVTAERAVSNPQRGSIYHPDTFAAAQPVYFHPLRPDRWLMLFNRRWHTATVSTTDAGAYSSYTEDLTPSWVQLTTPTGTRLTLGDNPTIPMPLVTAGDSATLIDGVSRANDYLFILSSVTIGAVSYGVVAHWRFNTTVGAVVEVNEEVVPSVTLDDDQEVVFDRGLWYQSPHLIVFGRSVADNELYMIRKPWSRIGYNVAHYNNGALGGTIATGDDPRWQYYTGTGWRTDSESIAPIQGPIGPITSIGPTSAACFKDRTYLATVAADGSTRNAVVYTARKGRPWLQDGAPVFLGTTTTYLGGTLQFQQMVPPSTSSTAMANNAAAIPYVISTKVDVSGDDQLHNGWGLWPVPR